MKKKYFYQIIAFLLCVIMIFYSSDTTYAKRQYNPVNNKTKGLNIYKHSKGYTDTIYVDGYRFNVMIDQNNTIILDGTNQKESIKLNYYENGIGTINLNGKNYDLVINSLTDENIDISVYDNNKLSYQYDENLLGYDGQASVAIGGAAWVAFQIALNTLIILGIIEVASVVMTKYSYDWYDAKESAKAIAADSKLQKYYYPALVQYGKVYIALYNPINTISATKIVKADSPIDLYSYDYKMAMSIITSSGFTLESVIADYHKSTKGLQFKHYHKAEHRSNLSSFHSLFGTPTLVK